MGEGLSGKRGTSLKRSLCWACLSLTAAFVALAPVSTGQAGTVPPGFSDELVTTLPQPVGLAFTPDGRLLITTKPGLLRVYTNGTLVSPAALDLTASTCTDVERGLVGVAVDPQFTDNRFIYLYYTFKKYGTCDIDTATSPVNRVSRFVLGDDNHVDPLSEVVLVDGIPSRSGNHNAGDLEFGKDDYLYVSTGDGGCDFRGDSGCYPINDASRDLGGLSGKILRITRNGGIPTDNPYTGSDSDRCNVTGSTTVTRKCGEIYAWGLRNPFRFDFDPNSLQTRFFINDVGLATWEEIDLGGASLDYGWNVREGPCARASTTNCGPPPPGMTNPIYWYDHTAGCSSVTLSEFVPGNVWPDEYVGAYIYGDSVCGKMFTLRNQGGSYVGSEFGTDMPNLINGVFGPSGQTEALYYISWVNFPNNQIRRIVFTGNTNRAPVARASASPSDGDLPLDVNFDATQSSDPDQDQLSYEWDFGDSSPTGSGGQVTHTYTQEGTFTATLTVRDGRGGQDSATVRIDAGNNAPQPGISTPTTSYLFRVGDQIILRGVAYDPEDGWLPDDSLSWRVERHHNTHTHPYLPPTQGNNVAIVAPPPEDLESAGNSYLDVYLTATDSRGLSTTVARQVPPHKVYLTFGTDPDGFQLEVAGETITAPRTVTSWEGWSLPLNAFSQRGPSGGYWTFDSWSDGGPAAHEILTPAQPATYSARFVPYNYPRPGSATPIRAALVPAYVACQSPTTQHVPPLNLSSCPGPRLESSLLTLGNIGQGSGFVTLRVVVGNPSTLADEEDVSITAQATDVRNASDGSDFTGSLLLSTALRITDSANSSLGDVPGTVADTAFSTPMACAATPGETAGASCSLSTTSDTLVPGFAKESKRAVLSTLSLAVADPGADGQVVPSGSGCPPSCGTGDERAFLREGLFTP